MSDNISQQLDELSCDLMGVSLDALADGMDISVLLSYEDEEGNRQTQTFNDDSLIACLDAAHDYLVDSKNLPSRPIRYALTYVGSIAEVEDEYHDALIMEFGEKGAKCAYSAYSYIEGIGQGEAFMWSEPSAAGQLELLI